MIFFKYFLGCFSTIEKGSELVLNVIFILLIGCFLCKMDATWVEVEKLALYLTSFEMGSELLSYYHRLAGNSWECVCFANLKKNKLYN